MEIFAKLKKISNADWLLITVIGLLLISAAALGGLIPNFLSGEEFKIYRFANNLPHMQAWQAFFFKFGRLIEALYWTYEYEILGVNPLLMHSISFVLLLIIALLASVCYLNAWPQAKRSKALPYLFVFSLFINWVSTLMVYWLSYDNGRISLILFFLSGLALQRWAARQRGRWLLVSFTFFLLSVLTYENAAFLFPALLLLAWPLLPTAKKNSLSRRAFVFVGLSAVSGLILLIPSWFYGYISRTYAPGLRTPVMELDLSNMATQILRAGPPIYLNFGRYPPLNSLVSVGLLLLLTISTIWVIRIHRDTKLKLTAETRSRWTCIYLASLWFLIFGPLPYVLLGYDWGMRCYSSAFLGVFPLMFMVYETAKERLLRIVAVALILLFAGFGLYSLTSQSIIINQAEAPQNIFYRGLKDAVPHVRPNTVFIIINGPIGNEACASSLEMLYNQYDLRCALLSSINQDFHAIRIPDEIETSGQVLNVYDEGWIVIAVIDNVPTLLEELKPGDFDLLITWESTEPIRTDYQKIVTEDLPPPSAFYLQLLQRAKVLFP